MSYHVAAAGDSPPEWLAKADVIVVDPPRKGLEAALTAKLISCASAGAVRSVPRRLMYLSCGFEALTRDLDLLLGSGAWRLRHAHVFLFFPGTDSLETLVVLEECGREE